MLWLSDRMAELFARRRFAMEVIPLCVRWYLEFWKSYRHLAETMAERGVEVDHTTLFRWCRDIRRNPRNACVGTRNTGIPPDASTRLTFALAGSGSTCSALWIGMAA